MNRSGFSANKKGRIDIIPWMQAYEVRVRAHKFIFNTPPSSLTGSGTVNWL